MTGNSPVFRKWRKKSFNLKNEPKKRLNLRNLAGKVVKYEKLEAFSNLMPFSSFLLNLKRFSDIFKKVKTVISPPDSKNVRKSGQNPLKLKKRLENSVRLRNS